MFTWFQGLPQRLRGSPRPARGRPAGSRRVRLEELESRNLLSAGNAFQQLNLVSDQPGVAQIQDANLVNPWGVAVNPRGAIWVSDNGTGVTTLYQGDVNGSPFTKNNLTVTGLGSPTGQVFNGTTDFAIPPGASPVGPAIFIFVSEDGTITAWNPGVPPPPVSTQAQTVVTVPDAVFKGVALANNTIGSSTGNFLYAADFRGGTIDVHNTNFQLTTLGGDFSDPNLPSGYAPFNIQNLNGKLYVTYAKQDQAGEDDVPGPGRGFINVFDTDGHLLQRLASGGVLNAPWGLALAPANFGDFSNTLLVGNFGDGRINAYDPNTGQYRGQLEDPTGKPVAIDGLWALTFGNGVTIGDLNALYFTAGPDEETHGLLGSLRLGTPASIPQTERLVNAMYRDLLGRDPDASGLQFWSNQLNSGVSVNQVATQIATSQEGDQHQVQMIFQAYLRRDADPFGLTFFTDQLQGGSSVEDVRAAVLGSQEYFTLSGGTTTGLLTGIYQDVLSRDPDSLGQQVFLSQLAGGATNAQVAAAIVTSAEGQQLFVKNTYQQLLGRDAVGLEAAFWNNLLLQTGDEIAVLAGIMASPEFQSHIS